MGWKVVTIIGAHGWGGGPRRSQPNGWGQPKKTVRTVDGPLLHIVTKAYQLHVFLSLANLNIQKSLKHSNTRSGKAQLSTCAVFGATEPSSPSRHPASERSTNRSLTCKQKKMWKSPIQHPRAVFCAHRAHAERHVSKRLNTEFASSTKLCQNTRLVEYRKNCRRTKSDVYHYNGCIAS